MRTTSLRGTRDSHFTKSTSNLARKSVFPRVCFRPFAMGLRIRSGHLVGITGKHPHPTPLLNLSECKRTKYYVFHRREAKQILLRDPNTPADLKKSIETTECRLVCGLSPVLARYVEMFFQEII